MVPSRALQADRGGMAVLAQLSGSASRSMAVGTSYCATPTSSLSSRSLALKHIPRTQPQRLNSRSAATSLAQAAQTEPLVKHAQDLRAKHIEAEAMDALAAAVEHFTRPVFPCALIAGDVVILHLLSRLHLLETGTVKVVFVDTFHLFPETHELLHQLEDMWNFKAHEFHAAGFADKAEYKKAHGSDLFIRDIDEYDRICKVEPFARALKDLQADVMINGRRRDHGSERAFLEVFEEGNPAKCQPLAYWSFADCWDYISRHSLPYHPLHDQGFPSVGDIHSTAPVPRDKWFEYGGERAGRFQGLTNKDGSAKTECGIHVFEEN